MIKLDELRDKERTMDRDVNVKAIENFIESSILMMMHNRTELQEVPNYEKTAWEKIKDRDGKVTNLCYKDAHVEMIEDIDVWLVIDYDVNVFNDLGEIEFGTIHVTKIMCYWGETEWNFSKSEAIKLMMEKTLRYEL